MKSHSSISLIHTAVLHLVDGFVIVTAFFLAFFLREASILQPYLTDLQPFDEYLLALPIAVVLFWVVGHLYQFYGEKIIINSFNDVYTSLQVTLIWSLVIMAMSYLTKYDYSRLIVLQIFLYTGVGVLVMRTLLRVIFNTYYQKGIGARNILILGAGRPGKEIARQIEAREDPRERIVGYLDNHAKHGYRFDILGTYNQLPAFIKRHDVHEVYITDPSLSHEEVLNIMSVQTQGVQFKVVSDLFRLIVGESEIFSLSEIPTLDLWRVKQSWWAGWPKRLFDVALALFSLVVTMPLWILISLAIMIDDGWPILFTQKRVGINGKEFKMYKFRTMKKDAPAYDEAPETGEDPRLTRTGRWLRKTSLDELPQFINVLKGDMSLVGPRPEMPFLVERYSQWQQMRLKVKPGMTGLWQILGRKDLPLKDNLQYDFYYITNQSPMLDLSIMVRTIPVVVFGRGAW